MKSKYSFLSIIVLLLIVIFTGFSCKKLVEVPPPVTSVADASVYSSNSTAIAVLTGIYEGLVGEDFNGGVYDITTSSFWGALSADELTLYSGFTFFNAANNYYTNGLNSNGSGYEFWQQAYNRLFSCNAAIEGLSSSNSITPAVKKQLMGEAKFLRAYYFFYLVNLYGDVPLALSSDYKINERLARSSKNEVYAQIKMDLKDAQDSLSENFLDATLVNSTSERVRPTKWAATALLARTYLYTENWDSAEAEASMTINNTSLFNLQTDLNSVFLANSNEAIWQLQPVRGDITNTVDAFDFVITSAGLVGGTVGYLSNGLLNSFEPGDLRRQNWVDSTILGPDTFYFPFKYKAYQIGAPVSEYLMMFRLAEQYLIRAEARAQQNNYLEAAEDLNAIRTRAGLQTTGASDKNSLLTGILHERQVELFTELGQRWLDLKRTASVDSVMSVATPVKGGTWQSYQQLYPLSVGEILLDNNLVQNLGY